MRSSATGLPCSDASFSRELACPLCDTVLTKDGVVTFDVRPDTSSLRERASTFFGLQPKDLCQVLRTGLEFWESHRENEVAHRQKLVAEANEDRDKSIGAVRSVSSALEQEKLNTQALKQEVAGLKKQVGDLERRYAEKSRAMRKVAALYEDLKNLHRRLEADLLGTQFERRTASHKPRSPSIPPALPLGGCKGTNPKNDPENSPLPVTPAYGHHRRRLQDDDIALQMEQGDEYYSIRKAPLADVPSRHILNDSPTSRFIPHNPQEDCTREDHRLKYRATDSGKLGQGAITGATPHRRRQRGESNSCRKYSSAAASQHFNNERSEGSQRSGQENRRTGQGPAENLVLQGGRKKPRQRSMSPRAKVFDLKPGIRKRHHEGDSRVPKGDFKSTLATLQEKSRQ